MPQATALKAMVVDDQLTIRRVVRGSLHQLGCWQVTECADGVEALEALKAAPVHLVLSDMTMPRLDGLGLLKAVRSTPGLQKTAFIMLTSRSEAEVVRQAIALGVNNYITKPFTLDTFRKKIEAVLGPLT